MKKSEEGRKRRSRSGFEKKILLVKQGPMQTVSFVRPAKRTRKLQRLANAARVLIKGRRVLQGPSRQSGVGTLDILVTHHMAARVLAISSVSLRIWILTVTGTMAGRRLVG
jgi:hypothetical protein